MESYVVLMTPDLASEYLSKSVGNRVLRNTGINMLKGIIERGEWVTTHQGIALNKSGHLIDGHHRLNAIKLAKKTVSVMVTVGVDDAAYHGIDMGLKRSVSDVLKIDKNDADCFNFIARLYFGRNTSPMETKQIIECGVGDTLKHLIARTSRIARRGVTSAPVRAAAVITMMSDAMNEDYVVKQYYALSHLDYANMSASAQAFVRQLEMGKTDSGKRPDVFTRARVVFDYNKRDLSKIQVNENTKRYANEWLREVIEPRLK